jgi:hypothetical protein
MNWLLKVKKGQIYDQIPRLWQLFDYKTHFLCMHCSWKKERGQVDDRHSWYSYYKCEGKMAYANDMECLNRNWWSDTILLRYKYRILFCYDIVFCKMPPCWVASMVSPPTFRFDNFLQYDMIPRHHQLAHLTPHSLREVHPRPGASPLVHRVYAYCQGIILHKRW